MRNSYYFLPSTLWVLEGGNLNDFTHQVQTLPVSIRPFKSSQRRKSHYKCCGNNGNANNFPPTHDFIAKLAHQSSCLFFLFVFSNQRKCVQALGINSDAVNVQVTWPEPGEVGCWASEDPSERMRRPKCSSTSFRGGKKWNILGSISWNPLSSLLLLLPVGT